MPDIQIVVSREGVAVASKSLVGKVWLTTRFEKGAMPTGDDVIVYIEEAQLFSLEEQMKKSKLSVSILR